MHTFFRGCLRLRGDATARDLNHMQIDVDRYGKWVDEADRKVSEVNDLISDLLDIMDSIDRDVVQDKVQDDKDPVIQARRQRNCRPRSEALRTRNRQMQGWTSEKPSTANSDMPSHTYRNSHSRLEGVSHTRHGMLRAQLREAPGRTRSEPRPGQKRTAEQAPLVLMLHPEFSNT